MTVSHSIVKGGYSGVGISSADPVFVDPDGSDNVLETLDDNVRLQAGSLGIDRGANSLVPAGVTTDLDGVSRFLDDLDTLDCTLAPGTCGTAPIVDMGAFGFSPDCDSDGDSVPNDCDLCPGFDDAVDTDNDGIADGCDLCAGNDATGDSDGVCDDLDVCQGEDASGDTDNDGVCDNIDACPSQNDSDDIDGDSLPDFCDNCPQHHNGSAPDTDGDGLPDACDACTLLGDINCDGMVNLLDLRLVALHWLETL